MLSFRLLHVNLDLKFKFHLKIKLNLEKIGNRKKKIKNRLGQKLVSSPILLASRGPVSPCRSAHFPHPFFFSLESLTCEQSWSVASSVQSPSMATPPVTGLHRSCVGSCAGVETTGFTARIPI
jgi:hypothetical protein